MKTIVKFIDCPKKCAKIMELDWESLKRTKVTPYLIKQKNRIYVGNSMILYINKNNQDDIRGAMIDLAIIQGSSIDRKYIAPYLVASKGKIIG